VDIAAGSFALHAKTEWGFCTFATDALDAAGAKRSRTNPNLVMQKIGWSGNTTHSPTRCLTGSLRRQLGSTEPMTSSQMLLNSSKIMWSVGSSELLWLMLIIEST